MDSFRLAKLALTALKDNFVALDKPYKLTYAVTYRCQSHCATCSIWKTQPKGELTLDEIRRFANANAGFKWIEFTGGEPFLRSDIVDIAKAFVDNCKDLYIITMPTNSLCSQDLLARQIGRILDLGIPRLAISLSLDGYRELHDRIRGVPGNFDKVMDMARRLRKMQKTYRSLFFVFGYTMSRHNQGMFEKTYECVRKELPYVTYDDFHVNVAQTSEIYYSNTDANLKANADWETMAKEISALVAKKELQIGVIPLIEKAFLRKLVDYVRTGKSPMRSRSLDASLFLDSYGNVFPSIAWNRKVGNLRDCGYDLSKIWHNKEAEEIRKLIKEGKEPDAWTACEAYQAIAGNVGSLIGL